MRTLVLMPLVATAAAGLWTRWPAWQVERVIEVDCYGAFFSRNGRHVIAATGSCALEVFDARTGRLLREIKWARRFLSNHPSAPHGWRVLVESRRCGARALPGTAEIWDLETLTRCVVLRNSPGGPVPRHVRTASYSADGLRVMTTHLSDERTRVWDAMTGELLAEHEDSDGAPAVSVLSATGRERVAALPCSYFGHEGWWGRILTTVHLKGLRQSVYRVCFSPDRTRALAQYADGLAAMWDLEAGEMLYIFRPSGGGVEDVSFSPDGRFFMAGAPVRVWNAESGELVRELPLWSGAVFAPDGHVAHFGDRVTIWDPGSGRRITSFGPRDGSVVIVTPCGGAQLAWSCPDTKRPMVSPDGNRIVTRGVIHDSCGDETPVVRIWRRTRPEWWWGVFCLWEFWLACAFAGLFCWSVLADRRSLRPVLLRQSERM